jgi:hypothetical protein
MYVMYFVVVPTVSFAVGNQQLTANPAHFAFSDAGDGLTLGGVPHVSFVTYGVSFVQTMPLRAVDSEQG